MSETILEYKRGWGNWNCGSGGILSLSTNYDPNKRLIKNNNFGHVVEGGAGMTPPYLFVINLGDTLLVPLAVGPRSRLLPAAHLTQFLTRDPIRQGAKPPVPTDNTFQ